MAKSLDWKTYQEQIQQLQSLDYNYDEKVYHDSIDKKGWFVDCYQATLAKEPPGEPLSQGAFEAAKQAIRMYQFPDPKLIRAVFDPELQLPGRNMLMLAYFGGFSFTFGVRVTSVIDEIQTNKGGEKVQVWGYSYRTLKGHFEIGEIQFQVSKNHLTGEVRFDISSYSKPDRIPKFFYRVGFKLFGRKLQKHFAHSSIHRLQVISQAALDKLT